MPVPPHITLSASSQTPRRRLRVALTAVVAIGILVLAGLGVASVDLGAAVAALSGADPQLVALSALLYAACQSVSGLQWWTCQRAGGVGGLGAPHTLGLHWIARGACELLPASLGEAVRVALVGRHPASAGAGTWRVVGALGSYKAIDAVVMTAAVLAILTIAPPPGPMGDARWMALAVLAVAVLAVLVIRRGNALHRIRRRVPSGAERALTRFAEGTRALGNPAAVRMATMQSVTAALLRILSFVALLAALGLPVEAAAMVFVATVVSGAIPLAPGGAGTREAVLVPTLALLYGVPAASALALSVAIQVVALGTSLVLGAAALVWLGPTLTGRREPAASGELPAEPVMAAAYAPTGSDR